MADNEIAETRADYGPTDTASATKLRWFPQSEQQLENELVAQLITQGYERAAVNDEATLLANLQTQLEAFNGLQFSATEFKQVTNHLSKASGVFNKAHTLRDRMQLKRDDGSSTWIAFLDSDQPLRNRYQVTQQVTMEGSYKNRYDVTILVNGLPLVQLELKRRGLEIKEAFNQIQRYQKHSFWPGMALFQYVQLFVISNGQNTKYYANARKQAFEQTFYWANAENQKHHQLPDFAATFLDRQHLGKMLGRYIVLNESYKALMVLRPYQVYATEAIVERVTNPPAEKRNGYIWHTTGSGKTLTSFKTAQLVMKIPGVDKVVFCVDRKDLDTQTIDEFNAFKKGSVDSTDNTKALVEQFGDNTKLIVTTLQKLNTAIKNPRYLAQMEALRDKRVVFIFDECHRSQFGETHGRVCEFFRNHQLFGFTGTPIFEANAASKDGRKHTTKDLFHQKLHSYVITDAIKDGNVLRFGVEYVGRYKHKDSSPNNVDIDVEAINTAELFESPQRLEKITDYILAHHKNKTSNRKYTAMFCVSSVEVLIAYYELFAQKKAAGDHDLTVGTIFSYQANPVDPDADGNLDEDAEIIGGEGGSPLQREKLDGFIADYNAQFGTAYSTKDSKQFYGYYKDLAQRVKRKEVDILLVVNMFLTGFDSKPLNTLYVDKNLKHHGLIQAYSRTNRILDAGKSQGNIVAFRNLKQATDDAIALFSNVKAKEDIFTPPYEEYVAAFNKHVPALLELAPSPAAVHALPDEDAQLLFVRTFRELLRLRNVLESFAEFNPDDLLLSPQRFADYLSAYLDLFERVKKDNQKEQESILDDVDFELELIHRDIINVKYILELLAKLYDAGEREQTELRSKVSELLSAEVELRSKRELIEQFIEKELPLVKHAAEIPDCFERYWEQKGVEAFDALVKEEQLDADKLKAVIDRYVYTGQKPLPDPDIVDLIQRKLKITERKATRQRVYDRVMEYAELFAVDVA